jgi:hypothetical protein
MIVKIQPPSSKLTATLYYNERKADGKEGVRKEDEEMLEKENGHIVITRNVEDGKTLEEEFERLAILNAKKTRGRKLENPAFHMSVNPGPNDAPLSEAAIVSLVDEIMLGMGYEDCPYRIYKHTDTDREHYHVVSTRIGQDGKKINDAFENRKVNKIAEDLAEQYGYIVGLEEKKPQESQEKSSKTASTKSEDKAKTKTKPPYVAPFRADDETPVSDQLRNIHNDAMTWTFSTPEQYKTIMRYRYNTHAEEYADGIHLSGIDKTGKTCTVPMTEKQLEQNITDNILQKCSSNETKKKKKEKERIKQLAFEEIERSESLHDFRTKMLSKGVFLVISYTDEGKPFGITWLDKVTRCAFKGSELDCNLDWLKNVANERQWSLDKAPKHKPNSSAKPQAEKPGKKDTPKGHYRATEQTQKTMSAKQLGQTLKKASRNGQESDAPAIDKSSLKDDPNNIKI